MLMPRSHSIRVARSWARVCFRVGMHKPRIGFGGAVPLGTTSSPVLAPSCGKKRAFRFGRDGAPQGRGQDQRAVGQLTFSPAAAPAVEGVEQVMAAIGRRTTHYRMERLAMPNLTITYDETHRGIALWVQTRTDVPPWPILFDADQAHILLSGLHGAIDGETELRTVNGEDWPRVTVGWDEKLGKVAIWLQASAEGQPGADPAHRRRSRRPDRRAALRHRRPRPPARGSGRDQGR